MTSKEVQNLSYCGRQAHDYDRDRFLTALFAPAENREALFALTAFNLEIAKTREVVTEPMLGQIRLQWWRDAIAEVYEGAPRRHEVIEPLSEAVSQRGLTRAHFETLIDAREDDLTETAPPTLSALEDYCTRTSAPLIQLQLEVLGVGQGAAHEAAKSVGAAWALTGLMRAVPFHARQRRVYLPTAVVEEVAVEMGELFELRPHAGLAKAVEKLADRAAALLKVARRLNSEVGKAALPPLLLGTLTAGYLKRIRGAHFDVFSPQVQEADPLRQAKLLWASLKGRF
ncbi:MAG: phytoene/squalene synthase family protein [Pseudomonadota bacterium]